MTYKILESDSDLERYRHATHRQIDVLLPLDYLKRSRVMACFNENNEICGGFVIVLHGPFRVLESIPGGAQLPRKVKPGSVAELTGLWISRQFAQKHGSAGLWLRMFRELLLSSRRHFVYAYSLKKPHLGEIYSPVRPKVLFRGETLLLSGMDDVDNESVEIFSLLNLLIAPLHSPQFLVKRMRRRQQSRALQPVAWKLERTSDRRSQPAVFSREV